MVLSDGANFAISGRNRVKKKKKDLSNLIMWNLKRCLYVTKVSVNVSVSG